MDTILTDSSSLLAWVSPGMILFGGSLVLFGAAFTLCLLLTMKPLIADALISVLCVLLFLLLGTVAIEFSAAATPSYTFDAFTTLSAALSTHRWLLFQLPILLTITNIFVLLVYRSHMHESHAALYRAAVIVGVTISFACVIAIALESLI